METIVPYYKRLEENTTIWRYIDLSKYLSMLINSSLFFSRIDLLEDKYEGTSPPHQLDYMKKQLRVKPEDSLRYENFKKEGEEYFKKHTAVNCWHISEVESVAMWKTYLKSNEGIAIKSNYKSFLESFIPEKNHKIYVAPVVYDDYDNLEFGNILYAEYFHKRLFYSSEKELRAFIVSNPIPDEFNDPNVKKLKDFKGLKSGLSVKVDLNKLIKEIIVAPSTPEWIFEIVKNVTLKYEYNFPILRSKIVN